MTWVGERAGDLVQTINGCTATLVVAHDSVVSRSSELEMSKKCIVATPRPRLVFSRLACALLADHPNPGIHPTAVVHPNATIAPTASVGPFTYVGNASIGDATIVDGHVYIYDKVTIGKNCIIRSHCSIGAHGSGYEKDENGTWIGFPQMGATVLEDEVEVGANSYVARGALGETRIKRGTKIGLSVCVGHNVYVGEHSMILSNAVVGGSALLGPRTWISIGAVLRNGIKLGAGCKVTMGAVVYKDAPEGSTIAGNPGREISKALSGNV